ncbi:MAG: hypothetical protein PHC33_06590, partial [Candidatus Omnitrophica bacterium]|nr:hypothetical protein [Candidatus Omnitrophota bacterium]
HKIIPQIVAAVVVPLPFNTRIVLEWVTNKETRRYLSQNCLPVKNEEVIIRWSAAPIVDSLSGNSNREVLLAEILGNTLLGEVLVHAGLSGLSLIYNGKEGVGALSRLLQDSIDGMIPPFTLVAWKRDGGVRRLGERAIGGGELLVLSASFRNVAVIASVLFAVFSFAINACSAPAYAMLSTWLAPATAHLFLFTPVESVYNILYGLFGPFEEYFLRSMVLNITVLIIANIVSQRFEIQKKLHERIQWERAIRTPLLGIFVYPFFWALVWYRWLLPVSTNAALWLLSEYFGINNPPLLPVRWFMDMVFWSSISLWFGMLCTMVLVERKPVRGSLRSIFFDDSQKGWRKWRNYPMLVFCVNFPIWALPKAVALINPEYAFWLTQVFVIPSATSYAYLAYVYIRHAYGPPNLWYVIGSQLRAALVPPEDTATAGNKGKDGGIGLPVVYFAGKCALDDSLKQARQLRKLGFRRFELFIAGLSDLDALESMKTLLRKVNAELGMECVSVHSPNAVTSLPAEEISGYIAKCQELVVMLACIQREKPAGVVLHELRGGNYLDFTDKIDAFHYIFQHTRQDVKILIEGPVCGASVNSSRYLSLPLYLDILVRELRRYPHFGLTFDFDHAYHTLLLNGLINIQKNITDWVFLWYWRTVDQKRYKALYPGIEEYLAREIGLDVPLEDASFDARVDDFIVKYGPVLKPGEIRAMRGFRKPRLGNGVTRQFGFDTRFVKEAQDEESRRHRLFRGLDMYPRIIGRMVSRYDAYIGLFHFTGLDVRALYRPREDERFSISALDAIELYDWLVYIKQTHINPFDAVSSIELQPLLLSTGWARPVVLETAVDGYGKTALSRFLEADRYALLNDQINFSASVRQKDGGNKNEKNGDGSISAFSLTEEYLAGLMNAAAFDQDASETLGEMISELERLFFDPGVDPGFRKAAFWALQAEGVKRKDRALEVLERIIRNGQTADYAKQVSLETLGEAAFEGNQHAVNIIEGLRPILEKTFFNPEAEENLRLGGFWALQDAQVQGSVFIRDTVGAIIAFLDGVIANSKSLDTEKAFALTGLSGLRLAIEGPSVELYAGEIPSLPLKELLQYFPSAGNPRFISRSLTYDLHGEALLMNKLLRSHEQYSALLREAFWCKYLATLEKTGHLGNFRFDMPQVIGCRGSDIVKLTEITFTIPETVRLHHEY